LQPRTSVGPGYRLIEPMSGLHFAAKDLLGLVLNQLNTIHFLTLGSREGVCSILVGGRCGCLGLGTIFAKQLDAAFDDQF